MDNTLKNKVAIVTGASSGIGEATSRELAARGAAVVLAGRVADLRAEDLRHVFEVNVVGPLNCVQAALGRMGPGARIINVSSVIGLRAVPKVGGYCATKFALGALSDSLRVEIADRGITVTSVYPGTTLTDFRENSLRTKDEKRGWRPKGVTPEKVAERIAHAAEEGPRDVYVSLTDRLYVMATILLPGLADRVLRAWARD